MQRALSRAGLLRIAALGGDEEGGTGDGEGRAAGPAGIVGVAENHRSAQPP